MYNHSYIIVSQDKGIKGKRKMNTEKQKNKKSFNRVVFILSLFLAFAAILINFVFLYNVMVDVIVSQKKTDAMNIAKEVDYYLAKNMENLNLASVNIEHYISQGMSNEDILKYMEMESRATSAVVDENFSGIYGWIHGEYLDGMGYDPEEGYVPQDRPWYTKAKDANHEAVLITPYIDTQTGRIVVSMSRMLEDNDSVLSMDIFLDYLEKIAIERVSTNEMLLITDEFGSIVASKNEDLIGQSYTLDDKKDIVAQDINSEYYFIYEMKYNGKTCYCYDQTIIGDWHVILIADRNSMVGRLWSVSLTGFVFLIIVFIIITFIFHKMDTQRARTEKYNSRLSTVADIYICMYEVDLVKDTHVAVKTQPFIQEMTDKMTGPTSQIIQDLMKELIRPDKYEKAAQFVDFSTLNERLSDCNTISLETNGYLDWAKLVFVPKERDKDGNLTSVIFLIEDINREVAKRNALKKEANTDRMTGLMNRRAWEETMADETVAGQLKNATAIVMDLNGLKKANDNLGHVAGDEIIVAAAHMIGDYFKEIGTAYRTGGDEFVVLSFEKIENVTELINGFKETVSKWRGEIVESLTISVGVARGDEPEIYIYDDLLKLADKRMYQEKEKYHANNPR